MDAAKRLRVLAEMITATTTTTETIKPLVQVSNSSGESLIREKDSSSGNVGYVSISSNYGRNNDDDIVSHTTSSSLKLMWCPSPYLDRFAVDLKCSVWNELQDCTRNHERRRLQQHPASYFSGDDCNSDEEGEEERRKRSDENENDDSAVVIVEA